MKNILKYSIIGMLLILTSCDKENNSPDYTLDSESHKGFLFENLKIVDIQNSSNLIPDFIVSVQISESGVVLSPFMSHPNLENRFVLSEEFESSDSAQTYFDKYSKPENKPFQNFALNIKPNQIWLIKTNTGEYGKILVLKTKATNSNNKPFAEMTFKAERMK